MQVNIGAGRSSLETPTRAKVCFQTKRKIIFSHSALEEHSLDSFWKYSHVLVDRMFKCSKCFLNLRGASADVVMSCIGVIYLVIQHEVCNVGAKKASTAKVPITKPISPYSKVVLFRKRCCESLSINCILSSFRRVRTQVRQQSVSLKYNVATAQATTLSSNDEKKTWHSMRPGKHCCHLIAVRKKTSLNGSCSFLESSGTMYAASVVLIHHATFEKPHNAIGMPYRHNLHLNSACAVQLRAPAFKQQRWVQRRTTASCWANQALSGAGGPGSGSPSHHQPGTVSQPSPSSRPATHLTPAPRLHVLNELTAVGGPAPGGPVCGAVLQPRPPVTTARKGADGHHRGTTAEKRGADAAPSRVGR